MVRRATNWLGGATRFVVAPFAFVEAAAAEVCDKTNPDWVPKQGPVAFWPELSSALMSPLVVGVALSSMIFIVLRMPTMLCILGVAGVIVASLDYVTGDSEFLPQAVLEGCATGYPIVSGIYAALGLTALTIGLIWQPRTKHI